MAITAQAVKELRDRTGAGMMDCKKALTETDGDLDEAIKFLRTKGLAAAAKKAHRTASDGVVVVTGDETAMVVLELNCETDFVARNPDFVSFAEALAEQALSSGVANVDELKAQPMSEDPEHTVAEAISQKVATIGENVVLNRIAFVKAGAGNRLNSYTHGGGKIGVVIEGTGVVGADALHDVALHVAATEPRFVNREEVTAEVLAGEREIALKQAMEQGKPEEIAKRIVDGKMEKFFVQEVLLEQAFAKDTDKSVKQYLEESAGADATVVRFVRFKLGEESDA
jgi:elongation factor Ts